MSKGSGVKGKTVYQQARALLAAERREEREKRSPSQQLELLEWRPGAAARERTRLQKQAAF